MRDCVEIRDLRVRTILGINDGEREEPQDITISLWIFCDTRKPGASDRIEDAINYRDVAKRVLQLAESSKFFLVERLAEEIARICVRGFGASKVRVNVEKPGAVRHSRAVGVTIEREPDDFRD